MPVAAESRPWRRDQTESDSRVFHKARNYSRPGLTHEFTEFAGFADEHIREGRFQRSLSLLAGLSSVLSGLEVAYEHYRGSYSRRIMYTPVILSGGLLAAGVWAFNSKRAAQTVLPVVSLLTLADGAIGFVFHVRGIHRKPGGWRVPVTG